MKRFYYKEAWGRWAVLVSSIIVLSFLVCGCSDTLQPAGKTPRDEVLEAEFVDFVGSQVNLNQDLVILYFGKSQEYPHKWAFVMKNNSGETIVFPDHGYGMQLYAYDTVNKIWKQVERDRYWVKESTTFSPGETTALSLDEEDIQSDEAMIRVYFSGAGSETGKSYGAFADIDIAAR